MLTTDLVNLCNRNIFKTSLYNYIFQDEKCRLMRNLSLSMVPTLQKRFFSPFLQFWILSQGFLLHVIQPSFWNMKLLNSKMLKVFYLCYTCKWISQVEGGGGTIWSPSDISSYFNPLFHSNSYSALDYMSQAITIF